MSRRANQKLKLMYLSKILLENTNSQHGMTLSQILKELDKYGIQCGRKCLYDDIEALRVFGIDIRTKRDRYVRYYVASRKFEFADIKLILDFISSCEYFTPQKANELKRRLTELCYGATDISSDLVSESAEQLSAANDESYNNINLICKAIAEDKKIKFKSFEWNSHKQRMLSNCGEYLCVSPIKLLRTQKGYLLVAYDDAKKETKIFMPQRLVNMSLASQKRVLPSRTDNELETIGPSTVNFRVRCDNVLASEVFERFGIAITILSNREETFEFSVKAYPEELYSWVFLSKGRACIISPEAACREYRQLLSAKGDAEYENE